MNKLLNKISVYIVIFFALLAGRSLIFEQGYFNMHDDLQMMRQFQMEKCLVDGQIPCRWTPDMGYGYGFPLFNFYPPLPYVIGQVVRFLGLSFITSVKINFAFSILISGVGMYLLAREFFGRYGGIVSAVFYIWAPYHAVDIYVRGALNESWALAWLPYVFLFSYKMIANVNRKWIYLFTLSMFALLTTHNLMVLIFSPFIGVWLLIHLLQRGISIGTVKNFILSGILSLGMAAFFTLPALFENRFTQVRSQLIGYYEYTAHFVSLKQLFISRFWGYGPSVWAEGEDGMAFQIGHLHWFLAFIVGFAIIAYLLAIIIKNKQSVFRILRNKTLLMPVLAIFLMGVFAAFMTHLKSINIYKMIPQLAYIQFPWRFLTVTIFCFSFVIGFIPGIFVRLQSRYGLVAKIVGIFPQTLITLVLIFSVIIFNWNYFRPEYGKMGPLTDKEKFSGAAWELQQTAGIYDYLPISAKTAPKMPKKDSAEIVSGNGSISLIDQGTDWVEIEVDASDDLNTVRFNILDFPGWRVLVNGNLVEKYIAPNEEWGRFYVDISSGKQRVKAEFINTPIRSFSNFISLVSFIVFLVLVNDYVRKQKSKIN